MSNLLNTVNLYEYIQNGLILTNMEQDCPFDLIIYEKLNNPDINIHNNINIHTLEELNYDFGISGTIAGLMKKYKNILFVLDDINYIYLLPLLKNLPRTRYISILNLGTGISGYINKTMPDTQDITMMMGMDINVYEPFDFHSLMCILNKKGNKYIRIANKEVPMNVFGEDFKDIDCEKPLVSLTEYEMSGYMGTVLCGGYMLAETIGALNLAQQDNEFFDLFCIVKYNLHILQELKDSIMKTEKLIVILDQKSKSGYEDFIRAKLWEKNLFDTSLKFIYPDTTKTNIKEHIFEQAGFNADSIYAKMMK